MLKWDLFIASISQREGTGESPTPRLTHTYPQIPTVCHSLEQRAATAICQRQAELEGKPIAPLKAYPVPKTKVGMTWGLTIHV